MIGTRAPASQTTPGGDATERDIPAATSIISSVALTFFAFLGFAVVSFSAADMENPRRDLPRAMYLSLIITTVLYVAIALGVYGMLRSMRSLPPETRPSRPRQSLSWELPDLSS